MAGESCAQWFSSSGRDLGRPSEILIVDDDFAVRTLMIALLHRRHARVECVGDGDAAIALLGQRQYDAIVLDLMLPETNGFDVIRHLQDTRPELLQRIVVVTAASNRVLRGFDSHSVRKVLRKPFDIDDFADAVMDACLPLVSGQASH